MTSKRGRRPLSGHRVDAATAWQQQQQLTALRQVASALPDANALPAKVSREIARVLLLLQRCKEASTKAEGSSNGSACNEFCSSSSSSSSSIPLIDLTLDADVGVQVAARHFRALLCQLQPCSAAAACIHAHLFAAWVRQVTQQHITLAAAAAAAAGTAPPTATQVSAAALAKGGQHASDDDDSTAAAAASSTASSKTAVAESEQVTAEVDTAAAAAAVAHCSSAGMYTATQPLAAAADATVSAAEIPAETGNATATGAAGPLSAIPKAAAAAGVYSSPCGPISSAWTLTSYQYGSLLLQLNMEQLLIDQLAWLQLQDDIMTTWRQQQQQGGWAISRLEELQLMLLADVVCAVPALAIHLLQQQQQYSTAAESAHSNSSSTEGSTRDATVGSMPLPLQTVLLLLCLGASAAAAADTVTQFTRAFARPLEQASCLNAVCQAIIMLLPGQAPQQQQQQDWQQQVDRAGLCSLPTSVLQHVFIAFTARDAEIHNAHVAHGLQQQQQQQQECGFARDTQRWAADVIDTQRLLAGLLQLLQELLLHWADSWYSSSSSSGGQHGSSGASSAGTVQVAQQTGGLLALIQQQLQQLLPQYLASRRQQQQQQETNSGCSVAAAAAAASLVPRLLPHMSHQLLVHTSSRLSLTLMMMSMAGLQQQQLQAQSVPLAVHYQSLPGSSKDWKAVYEDPFGRPTQQLLNCTHNTQQQQQQQEEEGCTSSSSSSSGNVPCWLCCLEAPQACSTSAVKLATAVTAAATATAAGTSLQRTLPCSTLRAIQAKQQQQQQQDVEHMPSSSTVDASADTGAAAAPLHVAQQQQQQQQQQQSAVHAVGSTVGHLAGLCAAWLTPGYSLGPLLQPPTGSTHAKHRAGSTSSTTSSSRSRLLDNVAAAAGAHTYGHLRLCCCLFEMLLHIVTQQQQQQQWYPQQLLLAMLACATQQLQEPVLQQALLEALKPTAAATQPNTLEHSLSRTLNPSGWDWLRQQLSAAVQPLLAAAASRGLVAASNKLVKKSENDANDGAESVTVVLPQAVQEALLLAELSRVLLIYQLLWPELTVRRLLLDAIQHSSQQPLVLQLLTGMSKACRTPAAVVKISLVPAAAAAVPAAVPAAAAAAGHVRGVHQQSMQQQQQQQESIVVPLLLDQLLQLLLPLPDRYSTLSGSTSGAIGSTTAQASGPGPGSTSQLELTEGERSAAVQFIQQLIAAGLVHHDDVLLLLLVLPLQQIWQQQQQYNHSQLRLLLQLIEVVLMMVKSSSATGGTIAAAASGWQQQQQQHCSLAGHPACTCPITCTAGTASAIVLPRKTLPGSTAAAHNQQQQQRAAAVIRWVILGLCRVEQQLQQMALVQYKLDYTGTSHVAALLEAVVTWSAQQELAPLLLLLLLPDEQAQTQQQGLGQVAGSHLQQLTWQQRLLISTLLQQQQQQQQHNGQNKPHTSSSTVMRAMMLPDSLLAFPPGSSSSSDTVAAAAAAAGAGTGQVSHARQMLLHCCKFAAVSDQHAMVLTQAMLASSSPAAAAAAQELPPPPHHSSRQIHLQDIGEGDYSQTSDSHQHHPAPVLLTQAAAAAAAAVRQLSWSHFRQGVTLALGQFLPWAPEHQAARVWLRLLPALLKASKITQVTYLGSGGSLAQQMQDQQDPQHAVTCEGEMQTKPGGLPPPPPPQQQQQQQHRWQQQQQQRCLSLDAALWCAEMQLVTRAVYMFLTHGGWAQGAHAAATAAAALTSSSSSSHAAKQAAAQQCFRHVALLVLHITQQVPVARPVANSSSTIAITAIGASPTTAAAMRAGLELIQVCIQQVCALTAALSAHVDCSPLQALLLQLLVQLFESTSSQRSSSCDENMAAAAVHEQRMPPPPPPAPPTAAAATVQEHVQATAATETEAAAPAAINVEPAPPNLPSTAVAAAAAAQLDTALYCGAVQEQAEAIRTVKAETAAAAAIPWESVCVTEGVPLSALLMWVGQQLQLLPKQMRQVLVPAVVHVAEQQISRVLRRGLQDQELEAIEKLACGLT